IFTPRAHPVGAPSFTPSAFSWRKGWDRYLDQLYSVQAREHLFTRSFGFRFPDYRISRMSRSQFTSSPDLQLNPRRRMITGVLLTPYPTIHSSTHQPPRNRRRQQQMIQPHAFIFFPSLAFIIPEGPERPFRLQLAQRI